jgi:hypothetical protein
MPFSTSRLRAFSQKKARHFPEGTTLDAVGADFGLALGRALSPSRQPALLPVSREGAKARRHDVETPERRRAYDRPEEQL